MDEILGLASEFLHKRPDFLYKQLVKFFSCYNIDYSEYVAREQFNKDHYFILVYLIFLFEDRNTINEDQVLIIVYILYSNIIDDETSRTSYIYPVLEKYSKKKFDNLVLQINSRLFRHIFEICNNDKFIEKWRIDIFEIIKGNAELNKGLYYFKDFKRKKELIGLSN